MRFVFLVLGHSPRMQNQAYSLATQGKKHVDFVGFPGAVQSAISHFGYPRQKSLIYEPADHEKIYNELM